MATALVLLMTPALAFFTVAWCGRKNSLNTMMMSYVALGFIGILWALVAYSLSFSEGSPWLGGFSNVMLNGVDLAPKGTIPHLLFMAYQGTFAIITAALISGAIVERMKFWPYVIFISAWMLVVYAPVAHWVWGGGWLGVRGVLDFAGGTVVHINAGISALVAAMVLGSRKDYGRQAILPHNVPFVLLGAGLLWFGWFGFNGGSALAANATAALAFTNTFLAPMATLVVWCILDTVRTGHVTAVGGATGIVVGLVAITPRPASSAPRGTGAGSTRHVPQLLHHPVPRPHARRRFTRCVRRTWHRRLTGALLTGVFAAKEWGGTDGLLAGTRPSRKQALGAGASFVYAGLMTFIILKVLGLVMTLRADQKAEGLGLDVTQHGEEAHSTGEGSILVLPDEITKVTTAPVAFPSRHPLRRSDMYLIVAIFRPES